MTTSLLIDTSVYKQPLIFSFHNFFRICKICERKWIYVAQCRSEIHDKHGNGSYICQSNCLGLQIPQEVLHTSVIVSTVF